MKKTILYFCIFSFSAHAQNNNNCLPVLQNVIRVIDDSNRIIGNITTSTQQVVNQLPDYANQLQGFTNQLAKFTNLLESRTSFSATLSYACVGSVGIVVTSFLTFGACRFARERFVNWRYGAATAAQAIGPEPSRSPLRVDSGSNPSN